MKRITSIILLICIILTFAGCAKCVKEEYLSVDVKITNQYHRAAYTVMIPVRVGNMTTMQPQLYPSKNEITVEFKGVAYTFNDRMLYEKYQNKIGEIISGATLEIKTYDDGMIKRKIIKLP